MAAEYEEDRTHPTDCRCLSCRNGWTDEADCEENDDYDPVAEIEAQEAREEASLSLWED